MKKTTFFVTLLFLSFSVFSASVVYTSQDNTNLRSDKTSSSKVLEVLSKDAKLQRITMHYSGWSQVNSNGLNGWILSDKLTQIVPKNTNNLVANSGVKDDNSKYIKQIKTLEESLGKLQLENKALSSEITDIKALKAEISTKKIAGLSVIEQQNNGLSAHNIDLQSQLDSIDSDNRINTLFIFILGLIIGIIVSVIIGRLAQKKRDSFNTISRSY